MEAKLLHHNDIDKTTWDAFISASPQGCIFMYSWYIQAVADDWQGIIVTKNNEVQAVMPLIIKKKLGVAYALQPLLAKYWGLCFRQQPGTMSSYEEYSYKRKACEAALKAIPSSLAAFDYNFHPSFDYPLPFHWSGFELHTRYTYRLNLSDVPDDSIESAFSSSMKNKIKKANKAGLSVKEESAITPLLTLLEQNEKSGKTILERQYFPMLVNVYEACRKQGAGKLMSAADADGKVYSAALILKDNNCTYLFSGINDPHLKQFAGKPLLVKEGIQMARKYGCTHFDFLGSMSEPIESFNRGFSANPIPYLRIFRYSKLASVMKR